MKKRVTAAQREARKRVKLKRLIRSHIPRLCLSFEDLDWLNPLPTDALEFLEVVIDIAAIAKEEADSINGKEGCLHDLRS